MKKKVLVLCHDTVGAKMAGPGIRYRNLADQISRVAQVTLGVFSASKKTEGGLITVATNNDDYKAVFDKHDVIFAQWLSSDMINYAHTTGKIIIIDFYAPVPIEYLASLGFSDAAIGADQDLEFSGILETYRQYLTLGDFFVCSNERQRDWWIGFMTASGLLKPSNFRELGKVDRIALCPMGISSKPPTAKKLQLRQRAGLATDDFVMLWTGGIWDWFDAQLVIKAVAAVKNPKIKLVFLGTQHPNSKIAEMAESKATRALAKELGLIDKSVFFLDGWVPYDERDSYLLDADVAIYADKESVETRFSHRTRVLDHIWTGLPTICSQGDYLSEQVDKYGMGWVVAERTPEAFAQAIKKTAADPAAVKRAKDNIAKHQHLFTWETLTAELLEFIKAAPPKPRLNESVPARPKQRPQLTRRAKHAIKVLLGRVDV